MPCEPRSATSAPPLQGKVALVTGGARRIGAEIVRTLHEHGMQVAIHHRRSAAEAEALASELAGRRRDTAVPIAADLLDPDAPGRLVERVKSEFGRFDVLVNNASSFFRTPLGEVDEESWTDLVGTNLKAPLFLSRAAAAELRAARGSIVNLGDIHGSRPLPEFSVYCAAKAGLLMLTQALALELGPEVRVNAVSPGPILWPESGASAADAAAREAIVRSVPLKRTGAPRDIAATVLFLLREGRYINGQNLVIDGGRSLSGPG